ncbi:MAG TPA: GyrI-like domain-containing protein [Thermomicrobiales bacterium]|nr:GyrI-like domain-containing protein [Thermomicrobiales bacterium]
MPDRLDLRLSLGELYSVGVKAPALVDVPDLTVIAVEGVGDPAISVEYRESVQALMTAAWGIRAHRKQRDPSAVIKVMPLEGFWTLPGIPFSEDPEVRAQLQWSLQIVQPDDVTADELETVRHTALQKNPALVRLTDVHLLDLPGGPAATMLHIGPYSDEPATRDRIHEAIVAAGSDPELGHREIYLSDPRRTAPEKLRTILRVRMFG